MLSWFLSPERMLRSQWVECFARQKTEEQLSIRLSGRHKLGIALKMK